MYSFATCSIVHVHASSALAWRRPAACKYGGCLQTACAVGVQAKQNESKYTGVASNDLGGGSGFGSKSTSFGKATAVNALHFCH